MRLVAFDSETYQFRPGLMAPPLVVGTFAWFDEEGRIQSDILLKEEYLDVLETLLDDEDTSLVAANTAYDVIVSMAARPSLIPLWFQAYEQGRVFDVAIRQKLLDIAEGRIDQNGRSFVVRGTEFVPASYSLASLEQHYLGIDRTLEKQDPDSWRTRYHELDGVPLEDWPQEAVAYAIEDAIGALRVFQAQGGPQAIQGTEAIQTRAALGLDLMTFWGVRTDRGTVEELESILLTERTRVRRRLIQSGLLAKRSMTPKEAAENPEKLEGVMEVWAVRRLTKAQEKTLEGGKVPGSPVELLTQEIIDKATNNPDWAVPDTYAQVVRREVPWRWAIDTTRLREYVLRKYSRKGLEAPTTQTGKISTSKDTCYESGSLLLQLAADGGGVDTLINTYLPVLKRGLEVPINPRYEVLVNTGRTSSSSWQDEDGTRYGFNIQNLPTGRRAGGEKVRESFVPRPGFLYLFADYKTLELCTLGQVCIKLFGKSAMADAINEGRDLHSMVASEMLGQPYEEILKKSKISGSPESIARDTGKVVNFGLPGGLGTKALVDYARALYGLRLSETQAMELRTGWRRTWPEAAPYLNYISRVTGDGGVRIEHPITGFVRGDLSYTEAANHMFQHLAATGAKIALFEIVKECYVDHGTALFGCRPVAFIHDEFGLEVPIGKGHEASERLCYLMESCMMQVTPDVKITAEPVLMGRWYKQAEGLYCDNKHLVQWTPELAEEIDKARENGTEHTIRCEC